MSIATLLSQHSADLSWQREFYEDLHRNPELSHQEVRTAGKIVEKLRDFDCEIISGIGGHGIVAIFRNPAPAGSASAADAPVVLMRADFDGLPVVEDSGAPYASTNGAMHACAHDMHATALLGACAIIDAERSQWHGTFIALFQPAEETSEGARMMVEDDLVGRIPAPQVCLAQHVMPGPAGQIQSRPGPIMAGCDSIRITITGKSAHASAPHHSIDPTYIAAMIVVRLQAIVGREIPPSEFFVISVGELHAGDKNNIIPETATLVLNTRFYDDELARKVYASLHRVVEAECAASGTDVPPRIEYFAHGEITDNSPAVHDIVRANFDEVFGEMSVTTPASTVSEDFCYLPQAWGVDYFFWFVGSTPAHLLDNPPVNHQANFLPDFEPTCAAATLAGATAVLSYLAH